MNTKDKVFLARADAVTETYQKRIAKLQDRLAQVEADIILDTRGWKRVIDGLDTLNRLEKLQAEQQQHTQRVRELRESNTRPQQSKTTGVIRKGSRQAGVWQSRRTGERRKLYAWAHPRLPHRHAERRSRLRHFRRNKSTLTRHGDRSQPHRNIQPPQL